MGMESSMMLERSCCPSFQYIKQKCVTHGSGRRLFTSGHGNIPSRSNGAADFVLTRQKDRKICLDVAVKRGAEYNTDHQFVCARIRMAGCGHRRRHL